MTTKLLIDLSGLCPAAASTVVAGVEFDGLEAFNSLDVVVGLTGPTGGTLDVFLQTSPDGGQTWVDYAHFAQVAAAAALAWFRFVVTRHAQQATIQTVGVGLLPALTVNTVVGGSFGDRMRVVYKTGVGVTVAAPQIIHLYAAT